MTEGPRPWWRPRLDGLAPRVAAYLSLALLPLGLIALYQTNEFQQETELRSELTLLALTEQGATELERALKEALGAGEALGRVATLLGNPETCAATLGRFVGEGQPYAFVGVVPAEGPVTCSSRPEPLELDDRDEWADLVGPDRPAVRARGAGTASGLDVLIVAVPMPGDPPGRFVALSIPRGAVSTPSLGVADLRPLRHVTFNVAGQILTSRAGGSLGPPLEDLLPSGRSLVDLALDEPDAFAETDAAGVEHIFTITPVVPGVAYAMAVWSPEQAGQGASGPREWPLLFPLLMWATSLAVAFWAIHRLVIRRVRDLVGRMRRFGLDRSLPPARTALGTPYELREIDDAFRQMVEAVLHDEARMEHAFRERGVLLREVHHRVKNNLQLISSIISMQVRRVPEPQVRAILRRLQDRVLTLASIYRSLYTSPDLGDVNAAPVLRAIVEQELRGGADRIDATLDIEDMALDPDQVVPLAFLTAEAVSNALARAAGPPGVKPSLSVTLHRDGSRARLCIANSLSGGELQAEDPSRGLGQHLIHAFAAQVGGPVEIQADDRLYRLALDFPVLPTTPEPPLPEAGDRDAPVTIRQART